MFWCFFWSFGDVTYFLIYVVDEYIDLQKQESSAEL